LNNPPDRRVPSNVRERAVPPGAVCFLGLVQRLVEALLLDAEGEPTNAKRVLFPASRFSPKRLLPQPDGFEGISFGLEHLASGRLPIAEREDVHERELHRDTGVSGSPAEAIRHH
jgi:hypothetical protein